MRPMMTMMTTRSIFPAIPNKTLNYGKITEWAQRDCARTAYGLAL